MRDSEAARLRGPPHENTYLTRHQAEFPRPRPRSASDSINVQYPPASLLARPPQQRRRPASQAAQVGAT